MSILALESPRLRVRPLALSDLAACHALYQDIAWNDPALGDAENLARRRAWLEWTVRNDEQLALLYQPPYGDRAVVDRTTGEFVGLVGLVPLLAPFGQLPSLGAREGARFMPQVGLFWAISPQYQRRGYATEAARALIHHAFSSLRLARIFAGTEFDNLASIAVMRKLGMTVERNPFPEPPWFQVVGSLEAGA
jgi:RimJ/RimL family protein N-acetyltransferase